MSNQPLAIVSGGSRGLGLAIVNDLIDCGYVVATFSRKATPQIEELVSSAGNRFDYQELDISNPDRLVQYVAGIHQRFGRIDALINNAAVARDAVLAMMSDRDISQMLDINLGATLRLSRECVRFMLCRQAGSIVNISSIVAERGFSGLSAYAATKAGLLGMTRSMARELGSRNIRVNAVAPGFLETEMSSELDDRQRRQIERRTPLGRLGNVRTLSPRCGSSSLRKAVSSPERSSSWMAGHLFRASDEITWPSLSETRKTAALPRCQSRRD